MGALRDEEGLGLGPVAATKEEVFWNTCRREGPGEGLRVAAGNKRIVGDSHNVTSTAVWQ